MAAGCSPRELVVANLFDRKTEVDESPALQKCHLWLRKAIRSDERPRRRVTRTRWTSSNLKIEIWWINQKPFTGKDKYKKSHKPYQLI